MLLIRVLSNQIANLAHLGQFDLALQYCDWGLTGARESGDPTGTALLTMTRGGLRAKLERWDDAMADYQQAERLFRFVGDRASVATLLTKQAMVWGHRGKPDVAVRILREQVVVLRDLGTIDELSNCLGYLGTSLKQVRNFADALKALHEQEQLARDVGDLDEVQRSLGNQGSVHFLQQHWEQALGLFQQREQVCRQAQNDNGLVEALKSQALIRGLQRNPDAAIALLRDAEAVARRTGQAALIADCLDGQAHYMGERGDHARALAHLDEAEKVLAYGLDRSRLGKIVAAKAKYFVPTGRPAEAIQALKRAEAIFRETKEFDKVVGTVIQQAMLYAAMVRMPAASLSGLQQALQLAKEHRLSEQVAHVAGIIDRVKAGAA
jgi:tetratricopeptide (TPR) repeat protein